MIFVQVINFVVSIILAKNLSIPDFGKFQLFTSIISALAIVVKLGLDEGFVYFIAKIESVKNSVSATISNT